MSERDIRWLQRLSSYSNALDTLTEDMELASERELSKIEKRGVIQSFEYTYELAWQVIKDFFSSIGETAIRGSGDAFRVAFERQLVPDGTLMKTIESRHKTVHTYNQETANQIFYAIVDEYYAAFVQLRDALQEEKHNRGL